MFNEIICFYLTIVNKHFYIFIVIIVKQIRNGLETKQLIFLCIFFHWRSDHICTYLLIRMNFFAFNLFFAGES